MTADQSFELGKLYCDRGEYSQALPHLYSCLDQYYQDRQFKQYFKVAQNVLRIYAEREEYEKLTAFKEKLHDLVIRENLEITARIYYVFGIAALYKGQVDSSLDYFKLSLDQALKANDKEDICFAILGIAICYRHQKKFEEALKEIYNLNIFLQFLDNVDLKAMVNSANAMILMDLKKYTQALDIYWQTYELTKQSKNITTSLTILVNIGVCLCELGQKDIAKIYFDLASKMMDPDNFKKVQKVILQYSHFFTNKKAEDFDLSFDFNNHQIKERKLGTIDFKNQFILLDLLKLFVSNQGETFSKEFLVEHVWKQTYDPTVHDNKIYVTIKRLRKLIEPDYDHPKYIFRSKNGYFLSRSVKIENQQAIHGGDL